MVSTVQHRAASCVAVRYSVRPCTSTLSSTGSRSRVPYVMLCTFTSLSPLPQGLTRVPQTPRALRRRGVRVQSGTREVVANRQQWPHPCGWEALSGVVHGLRPGAPRAPHHSLPPSHTSTRRQERSDCPGFPTENQWSDFPQEPQAGPSDLRPTQAPDPPTASHVPEAGHVVFPAQPLPPRAIVA